MSARGRLRIFLLLITLAHFSGASALSSCACFDHLPCEAFWQASAVFAGTVIKITESEVERGEGENRLLFRRTVAHFAVDEAFRGVEVKEIEIVADYESLPTPVKGPNGGQLFRMTSGSGCGYKEFRLGQQFLVYGYRDERNNELLARGCSRTQPLVAAKEDLAYIRGLSSAQPGGTILGVVKERVLDPKNYDLRLVGPIKGVKVSIEGEGRVLEASTDGEGRYSVSGLAPGRYKVLPLLPPRLLSDEEAREVVVAEHGCAKADFFAQQDGRVSGILLDAEGRAVREAKVDLLIAEQVDYSNPEPLFTFTDEAGRFEFKRVPPGQYLLGVRLNSTGSADFPYARTYYPGVKDAAEASLINLEDGQRLRGYVLSLPARMRERKITGTVVWPDGRPAARATVVPVMDEYEYNSHGKTVLADEQGRFSMNAFEGQKYFLVANVILRTAAGQMHADPVDIPASGDVTGVRLVITSPVDVCERCRHRYSRPKKRS